MQSKKALNPITKKEGSLKSPTTIAFLGPEGTFTELAALEHFGRGGDFKPYASIDDVFAAVAQKHAKHGVVPVENSTEGAVNNTQDCLIDSLVRIVGEVILPVEHHLLMGKDNSTKPLTKIASHKQSLAQCRKWILKNHPNAQLLECASNAEAAQLAASDDSIGAIAGKRAADRYGLISINQKIQDQEHNSTRFLVISDKDARPALNNKTSLLIYAENKPGSLYRILEPFENLQISLTKIETRPSKIEAWAYVFFIDFEGHITDKLVEKVFIQLRKCSAEIKILGSYPVFKTEQRNF
ncbi:prephenate dehydratase [Gammaproteobacteria bacterium]|nr:prephenate dehydratase [Gammaproteobacteria bacterium]